MTKIEYVSCESPEPEPEGQVVTFSMGGGSWLEEVAKNTVTVRAVAAASESFTIRLPERAPEPTPEELLTRAADTTLPLAHRLGAAEEAAYMLRRELERCCEDIFPDFYWMSSREDHPFGVEDPKHAAVSFPQTKKWRGLDDVVTPERDKALRDLGFVYLNGKRLGLVSASKGDG